MNLWFQIIASNILVATLIGLLAWQVGRRGRRSALAHLLWVVVFVKLVTPPIVMLPIIVPDAWLPKTAATYRGSFTFLTSTSGLARPNSSMSSSVGNGIADDGFKSTGSPTGVLSRVGWSVFVIGIWATGAGVVLCRGLMRFARFRGLLMQEGKHDAEASELVRRLLYGDNVKPGPSPQVIRIPVRVSPMLFGFGRGAVIVCPDQLWRSLSAADRKAFLAHESAHYFRRDHYVRWLEWIVTAIYWWFPAVYIARRQLERHEEACCDAWAVQRLQSSPRHYAEALLRVVDFISDYGVGIPRFASGMQPTDSLEERIRLVMRRSTDQSAGALGWGAIVACLVLWLVHPIPLALSKSVTTTVQPLRTINLRATEPEQATDGSSEETIVNLPALPVGFWNQGPSPQWANFSLALPGAQLTAEASMGISISTPDAKTLRFTNDELSAVVEIPSTRRIVIGDRSGNLRLWDLNAGMAVSLIGRHAGAVTSVAYHEACGLVSADDQGAVIRWDMQSGQVQSSWSISSDLMQSSVQSVRCSADGDLLAILTGGWNEPSTNQQVDIVDSRTLEPIREITVPASTAIAVVVPAEKPGWVAVDWAGAAFSLDTDMPATAINKHEVSALVLSQNSVPDFVSTSNDF